MLRSLPTALAAAFLSLPVLAALTGSPADLAAPAPRPPAAAAMRIVSALGPVLLDPAPARGAEAWANWTAPTLHATFRPDGSATPAAPAATLAAAEPPVRIAAAIPIPPPRPAELNARRAPALASRRPVAPPAADDATPSLLASLLGTRPATPALAYAALDTGNLPAAPAPRLSPNPGAEPGTALYDIGARTVTLPSGEVLEAHSGLGEHMDDARYVHLRMRGATPPGTYDLREREARFHGVRAIRLNPVGGPGTIHNRAGLLAHTYMLGPNGQSNGCVSFRDYDRFLQAYLRGEIRRLVVVAGRAGDGPRTSSAASSAASAPARKAEPGRAATRLTKAGSRGRRPPRRAARRS